MKFGENLKNIRKSKNISQEYLAEKLEYQDKAFQSGKPEKIFQV